MILFLAAASWFACGFLFGLVTGTPELRTFGLAGTVLFIALAWLTDWWMRTRTRRLRANTPDPYAWGDHFDKLVFEWPPREERKDKAA